MDSKIEFSKNQPDKSLADSDLFENSKESLPCYRCKKCRFQLFTIPKIVNHNEESNNQGFEIKQKSQFYAKSNSTRFNNNTICKREVYTEKLEWFENQLDEITGKINCPKCDSKLGSFDWSGTKCACGAWITPSFHFSKSKIDYYELFVVE
ncbi:Dual specificity phosphatase [Brachionus plicatilis]|uniref:Dual specificity phosphatase n=1 Tax=Brachionus plicatilis TaxID=10195 RepID=A0A3M7Q4P0_BRAPC|nr:Dual specificity phosphatase [Brachionus plicatilis]